jgi:anti-anti-sigma factor
LSETGFYFAWQGRDVYLRLVGDVRYSNSRNLDSFVANLLLEEELDSILVDLNETNYIDSTNLGLLARMALFMSSQKGRMLTLLCESTTVLETLTSMGFDKISALLTRNQQDEIKFRPIPSISENKIDLCQRLILNHKALIELDSSNAPTFQPIIDKMEDNLIRLRNSEI